MGEPVGCKSCLPSECSPSIADMQGCNWYPFEADPNHPSSLRERDTFHYLVQLAKTRPDLCERIPFQNVWNKPKTEAESELWFSELVKDVSLFMLAYAVCSIVCVATSCPPVSCIYILMGAYRARSRSGIAERQYRPIQDPIPGAHAHGREWTAFVMHAPKYMQYLAERARAAGIPLIRKRLSSLDEAYNLPETGSVDVVINATGLGAQTLVGVEDPKVYPGRGQTVLVQTPKEVERVCVMSAENFYAANDGAHLSSFRIYSFPGRNQSFSSFTAKIVDPTAGPAYIIPRPGPDPHVILGGVYLPHNYSPLPCLRTAERILKDCYNLRPELAGHSEAGEGNGWRDIQVVSHNVGLRPAREGGARVEVQRRRLGERPGGAGGFRGIKGKEERGEGGEGGEGRRVVVVHAYGFGSAG